MSNQLQIQSYQTLDEAVTAAAERLITGLKTELSNGNEVLLLLSGGSATKIYQAVGEQLRSWEEGSLEHLTLAVGDERWPSLNNTQAIKETGMIDICLEKGATWYDYSGDNLSQISRNFDTWLQDWQESNTAILVVVGIGSDGHTLGINADPTNPKVFQELFEAETLAVGYESHATTAAFPTFPQRITLTLTGLKRIKLAIGLVGGPDKAEMLRALKSQELPLAQQPAQALKQIPTELFTDLAV